MFSIFFFIFQFFYPSFLFSNPYLNEEAPSWKCKIDHECLNYLKNNLDKESEDSIYKVCQYEYDTVKNCCESLDNCPSLYGVDQDLENIKSSLLGSSGNPASCSPANMSDLISSVHGIQKEVCQLGAKNCKLGCENKLDEFERRIKNCFSITVSINKALEQAKTVRDEECYKQLTEVAEKYKRQSLNRRSELREDLSVQDIVDCEGIENKSNMAVGTKKVLGICSQVSQDLLQRQQGEQQQKEEEERLAREEEKQAEIERQKEEELARKQAEFEDKARMIQADMGYTSQDKNAETLNAQDNLQAQGSDVKLQDSENEKGQGSDVKTVKAYLSEKVKEETGKEKEKDKKTTEKENQPEEKKEDKPKSVNKKDKNQEDKKKSADTKGAKDTKQSEGSKIMPVVSTDIAQGASSQTTTPALKTLSKKNITKSEAKKDRR